MAGSVVFWVSCEKLSEDYNKTEYEQSVKIGVVGDVSVLREQVESMFMGAKLASEEINQKGGLTLLGEDYPIEIIFKNSAGSPSEGIKVVDELIEMGVQIIVGPTFSSVAVEMAEKCIENNVLLMSYAATTSELTFLQDNNLIWRTCPSDFTFGSVSAKHAFDSLESRKAAILYRNDRFGAGLSDIIGGMFMEYGGSITNRVSFPGDEIDISSYSFETEMAALLNEEPDVIYIVAFSSEVAALVNSIYNSNLYQNFINKPHIFLNDGALPNELIKNGIPEILESVVGITSTNENNPNHTIYKNNYIQRYGFNPSTFSEHAYDAVYLIAYAMQMADSDNPIVFNNYLNAVSGSGYIRNQDLIVDPVIINVDEFDVAKNIILKGELINYEGASGPISFDEYGDPTPKIVIWGIRNNKYVELTHYD